MGQGETLLKALQDAVPEDVRGKLTAGVNGILHAQGNNLKFGRALSNAQVPNALSAQNNQEKNSGISGSEGWSEDNSSLNPMKSSNSSADGYGGAVNDIGEPAGGTESEVHPSQKSQNSANLAQPQDPNNEVGPSDSFKKETSKSRGNNVTNEQLKEVAALDIGSEKELETVLKPHTVSQNEEAAATGDEQKSQNNRIVQTDTTEENNIQKVEQKPQDFPSDQSKTETNTKEESPSPPASSEPQTTEREGSNIEKKESSNLQHVTDQTNSTSSGSSATGFSVSQAFDTLTGMDDSTQVAVNSVFGVIENMISQLESSENKDGVKEEKDSDQQFQGKQKCNSQSMESNTSDDPSVNNHDDGTHSQNNACSMEEQQTQIPSTVNEGNVFNPPKSNSDDHVTLEKSKLNGKRVLLDGQDGHRHVNRMPQYIAVNSYGDPLYGQYLRQYLVKKIPTKSLDLDTTTALFLDYFPEEGQWKLLEQPQKTEISSSNVEDAGCKMKTHTSAKSSDTAQCIEPPYVILHSEKQQEPVKEFVKTDNMNEKMDTGSDRSEELIQFVKKNLLNSLKMEVSRKLSSGEMKEMKLKLAADLEHVANAISQAIRPSEVQVPHTETQFHNIEFAEAKVGTLDGEHIIRVISSSVHETSYLRRVLPVGVIVGTSLAALRKYFHVATVQDDGQRVSLAHDDGEKPYTRNNGNVDVTEIDQEPQDKISLDHSVQTDEVKSESEYVNKNKVMVGAVTAALGASALLIQQQVSVKTFQMVSLCN